MEAQIFPAASVSILPLVLIGGFFAILGLVSTVFWVWMLVDCAMNESSEGNDKIIWILIIIFTHWIGALIYILARRPKRIAELGK